MTPDNARPRIPLDNLNNVAVTRQWAELFGSIESWEFPIPVETQEVERMREASDQRDAETQAPLV